MSYLILPSRRTRQPSEIPRPASGAFATNLCFLWSAAAGRIELLSGRAASTVNAAFVAAAPGIVADCSSGQRNIEWNSWEPITTSDGAGTGNFTISVYANPAAAGSLAIQHLFAQKNDAAGAPFSQVVMAAHSNSGGAYQSGTFDFFVYSGSGAAISVSGACDGNWHLWTGVRAGGSMYLYKDGVEIGSGARTALDLTQAASRYIAIGSRGNGTTESYLDNVEFAAAWNRALNPSEVVELAANHQQLFASSPRRIWFDAGAGGGETVVTASASGRLRGRASTSVAATKTTSCIARERAVGAASTQPIKAVAVVGRERARGSNATAPISIVSAVGRRRARGSTSASQVAPGIVVTSAVGRERVRGSNTATSIRTVAVVGRRRARGADAASSIRAQLAAGRVRARGATTAAPIVAGTVVTSAVGRLRARGISSCTTTRVTALAGRVRARGSGAVAGFRVVAAAGRRRARGAASAGPAGVLVDSIAASRLWVRGTTAAVAMPPLVLVPARVCIGAQQPASVAINASILACDCN